MDQFGERSGEGHHRSEESGRTGRNMPPPPAPPPFSRGEGDRREKTCLYAVGGCLAGFGGLSLCALFVLFLILYAIGSTAEKFGEAFRTAPAFLAQDGPQPLKEETVIEGSGKEKIVLISIDQPIFGSGVPAAGAGKAQTWMREIRQAADDDAVKAVLLLVDTPGGGLSESDALHHEVQRLAEKKPVVAYVQGMAASGGYYLLAPSRKVVACPTALVGSIGVIMTRFNLEGLMEKIGVKSEPIKSGAMKDVGSPFRPMSPEEEAYFQGLVMGFQERFIHVVAEGRNLPVEQVRALADGRVFPVAEALTSGLVDAEGYFDTAWETARDLAQAPEARGVRYATPFPWKELFGAEAGSASPQETARALVDEITIRSETPRFEARWRVAGE